MKFVIPPALGAGLLFLLAGCGSGIASDLPAFDHVVVVIEENRSAAQVADEPYIASLIRQGLRLTNSHAVTHPSEPNYIALFSGSQHGVTDDGHYDLTGPNLCTSLINRGHTFGGYSQGLPAAGYRGDAFTPYVRKHAPWAAFTNTPNAVNMPFSDFPSHFSTLPSVSIVVPDLQNDMHDGSAAVADSWLRANLDAYVQWAKRHNSLFILTFDECDGSAPVSTTPILTVFAGAHVKPGSIYSGYFDHYSLLRTVEAIFGISPIAVDAHRMPLSGVWN